MSLRIGTERFPTKAAAARYFHAMLWRYPPGGLLAGKDLELVLALIEMHPSRDVIIDCGIRWISVQPVPDHEKHRRFLVKRTNESRRAFSWRDALSPKSHPARVASVLRRLIFSQQKDFKLAHFSGACETCGIRIRQCDCVVDHIHPNTFQQLMSDWLDIHFITAADVAIVVCKEYEKYPYLEDPTLERSWIEYHQINARLRCVCRKCNGSRLRKQPCS